MPEIHKRIILQPLEFSMKHNYFWFGESFYLQNKGAAKGDKFAPSMAKHYLDKWEEDIDLTDKKRSLYCGEDTSIIYYSHLENLTFDPLCIVVQKMWFICCSALQ